YRPDARDAPDARPRARALGRGAIAHPGPRARRRARARDHPARRRLPAGARRLAAPRAAGLPRRHDRRLRAVTELWLKVAGAPMHAKVLGEVPAVVLLHGYGVSGTYMLPLARVLVPELPGQGKSEPRPGLRSVSELAGALAAWLEAAKLEQPAVVANSLGC